MSQKCFFLPDWNFIYVRNEPGIGIDELIQIVEVAAACKGIVAQPQLVHLGQDSQDILVDFFQGVVIKVQPGEVFRQFHQGKIFYLIVRHI